MKDAYSNLLGEFLKADEVDYEDTSGFQIVCPCCRDAIFKVVQERPQGSVSFFSHYRVPEGVVGECERRVGNMSSAERNDANTLARAQSLELFRSVVRDAVALIPVRGELWPPSRTVDLGIPSEDWRACADFVRSLSQDRLQNFVRRNDAFLEMAGQENLTRFESRTRTRISADIVRTLVANNSRSFRYLYDRSFINFMTFNRDRTHRYSRRAEKLLGSWGHDDVPEESAPGHDEILFHLVLDTILRELYRIPYFKILDNARRKLPPLTAITPEDYIEDPQVALSDEVWDDRRIEELKAMVTLPPALRH